MDSLPSVLPGKPIHTHTPTHTHHIFIHSSVNEHLGSFHSAAMNTGVHGCGGGLIAQSCLTLCDPMNCSLPGISVHRILQASILEWVAISYSRGIFPIQESNLCLLHLLHWQADSLALCYLHSPIYTLDRAQVARIAGRFFTR